MWYEKTDRSKGNNFVSSRVRLTRNWDEYAFPGVLSDRMAGELVGRLQYGLSDIDTVENEHFRCITLDNLSETERLALKERRLMNADVAAKKGPVGLLVTGGEDVSILLNGDDHIRIQYLSAGMELESLWQRADRMDDYVNSRFNYAFDDKYGYLTSYPTNVGTGLRMNAVVHLPSLSKNPQSRTLIEGLSRFGVNIRGVYGRGAENYGSLYDISNAKTLGQSEKEILDMVTRIAYQLNDQEDKARARIMEKDITAAKDEVFKSYGILKYARTMSIKSALIYLSHLLSGVADGIIIPKENTSVYSLMLGVQPANLLQKAQRPMDGRELDILRAEYLREHLPEIKEA